MALNLVAAAALLFALTLSNVELSTCQLVKGKVSCVDCITHYDFSDIKVLVKCDKVKKLAMATTEDDGSFQVELPSDDTSNTRYSPSNNCLAKLLGGPNQLYVPKGKNMMVSKIVLQTHAESYSYYTISTPLAFSISRPSTLKADIGSSKTIDLPLPREWGLAPSSFYVNPFFPIIGIP